LKQSDSNRKRFGKDLVSCILVIAFRYQNHFLRREVSELFFEGSLLKIGFFVRPRKDVGNLDLPFLIDEYVVGSDISYLSVDRVKISGTADQAVEEIPQLLLFEVFVHVDSIIDFLLEKVRIVFIVDLCNLRLTLTEPTLPQNPLGVNSCLLGIRSVSLS